MKHSKNTKNLNINENSNYSLFSSVWCWEWNANALAKIVEVGYLLRNNHSDAQLS